MQLSTANHYKMAPRSSQPKPRLCPRNLNIREPINILKRPMLQTGAAQQPRVRNPSTRRNCKSTGDNLQLSYTNCYKLATRSSQPRARDSLKLQELRIRGRQLATFRREVAPRSSKRAETRLCERLQSKRTPACNSQPQNLASWRRAAARSPKLA